jgi:hypothetical protein
MNTSAVDIVLEPLVPYCRYAPLAVFGYWLQQTHFLAPLWSTVQWWTKSCTHQPQANLEAVLVSILAGNRAVYQINSTIRPDGLLARAWGQERFAEQSTLADLLDRAGAPQVAQVQAGTAALLQAHSRALRHDFARHWLLLDYDATGLRLSRHAEASEKGYFSGQRNVWGRQLVRIAAPAYHETLASYLYPGSTQACGTLPQAMQDLAQRCPLSGEQRKRTILRSDGGLGSDANINWLLAHDYQVLTKGLNHSRAEAQARQVPGEAWLLDADRRRAIAPAPTPPRFARRTQMCVVRWPSETGFRYGTLVHSLLELPPLSAWRLYDGRGAMEVEIRADKQGLNLPKRRKQRLAAQMLLILLTDVAHNLLSWFHAATLADGPCAHFGTLRIVQDLLCIPGRLEYQGAALQKVALLETHPYAATMAAALTKLCTQPTLP